MASDTANSRVDPTSTAFAAAAAAATGPSERSVGAEGSVAFSTSVSGSRGPSGAGSGLATTSHPGEGVPSAGGSAAAAPAFFSSPTSYSTSFPRTRERVSGDDVGTTTAVGPSTRNAAARPPPSPPNQRMDPSSSTQPSRAASGPSAQGAVNSGASAEEDSQPWVCATCTLENKPLHLQCDACGTARPSSSESDEQPQGAYPPVVGAMDVKSPVTANDVTTSPAAAASGEVSSSSIFAQSPATREFEAQAPKTSSVAAAADSQTQQRGHLPPGGQQPLQHQSSAPPQTQNQQQLQGGTTGRVALPDGFAKRRLEKERRDLLSGKVGNDVMLKEDQGDEWLVQIKGAEGTLYSGETFTLRFKFVERYPIERPEVVFVGQPPVHPHVYSNGHICLSILSDGWSPALSVQSVCLSLISMLSSCKKKERPMDDMAYCSTARFRSPKHNLWWFHDDTV